MTAVVKSGIPGLDDVLHGGLPFGRTTIVGGSPGSGKTVLATQFLVGGAEQYNEPGLMISFEEAPDALKANFPGEQWPTKGRIARNVHFIDGRPPEDAVAAGSFDVGGLVAIASAMIKKHGIKRIAIDGIDALFAISEDASLRRREIGRLLQWLLDANITSLFTIKLNEGEADIPPDFDLAEYAADGVIRMKLTMIGELARRSLIVVKMRGSGFEAGGHPYAISDRGIRVLHSPLHTLWLPHEGALRVTTGVERLDTMLLGGFLAGTTTLISGPPGAAKTTLAARFIEAGCQAGERCLFVGFDEPAAQMRAGVRSVGIHLDPFIESGALVTDSFAAGATIGDEHYLAVERLIDEHRPTRVVVDPVSALDKGGGRDIADSVRERLVVLFKERGITAIFTAIADNDVGLEEMSRTRVSTIADTWINLGFTSWGGERNRTLSILKSRGTGHSNQIRELVLSDKGLDLADVYTLEGDVLSGTARAQKEQQVASEREAEAEAIANAIEKLDREGQELMRRLEEAQRGLDRLAEHRAEIVDRARASEIARAKGTQAIHALRRGEDA